MPWNLKTFFATLRAGIRLFRFRRKVCTHTSTFRYIEFRQGSLPFLKPFLREHFFPFS